MEVIKFTISPKSVPRLLSPAGPLTRDGDCIERVGLPVLRAYTWERGEQFRLKSVSGSSFRLKTLVEKELGV